MQTVASAEVQHVNVKNAKTANANGLNNVMTENVIPLAIAVSVASRNQNQNQNQNVPRRNVLAAAKLNVVVRGVLGDVPVQPVPLVLLAQLVKMVQLVLLAQLV